MPNLPTANNNPGDLRNIGQSGASEGSGGFASFSSPQEGFGALLNDLQTKIKNHPDHSLADFANQYAPPTDGNDSAGYAAKLANQLQVSPDTKIGSLQPNIGAFAEAVASNEGYQPQNNPQATSPQTGQPNWLSALEGLGVGALGWVGSNIKPIAGAGLTLGGEALGSTLGPAGAVAGGVVGSTAATSLGLTGGQSNNSQGSTVPPTQQNSQQTASFEQIPQSAMASQAVQNAIHETMQGTQTDRQFSQSDEGKKGIQTASLLGLIEPDENGNLIYNKEKSTKAEQELGSTLDKVIGAEGGRASPVSVANYAGQYIGKDTFATDLDRKSAAEEVRKNLDATGVPMNGQMSLSDMREKQKQHYSEARPAYGKATTTAHMLAHKALGNAYGEVIRNSMKDPQLYDEVKKMQQNLIYAKQVGKRLNGKKAPKANGVWESFLRQGARAAEIYIGDRLGGPIGAIIGGLAGEQFNKKLDQKFGRNIFETKGMRAAIDILKDARPKEYARMIEALKRQGINATDESNIPDTHAGIKADIKKDEKTIGLVKRKPRTK